MLALAQVPYGHKRGEVLSSHTMQRGAIQFGHPGETLCRILWQLDERVASGFSLRSRAPLEIAILLFTRINNYCLGVYVDLDMICTECQFVGPLAPGGGATARAYGMRGRRCTLIAPRSIWKQSRGARLQCVSTAYQGRETGAHSCYIPWNKIWQSWSMPLSFARSSMAVSVGLITAKWT